jgi:hypothetical protein
VTLAAPIRLIQERHICLQLAQPGTPPGESGKQNIAPCFIPALGWSRGHHGLARPVRAGLAKGSVVDILYRIRNNTGPYAGPHFGGLELELCVATSHYDRSLRQLTRNRRNRRRREV